MNTLSFQTSYTLKKYLDELRGTRYTGTACGGLVTITLTFDFECRSVKIAPELADVELLEELIRNAFNDAKVAIDAAHKKFGAVVENCMQPAYEKHLQEDKA